MEGRGRADTELAPQAGVPDMTTRRRPTRRRINYNYARIFSEFETVKARDATHNLINLIKRHQ